MVPLWYYKRCSCEYGYKCNSTSGDVRITRSNISNQANNYEDLMGMLGMMGCERFLRFSGMAGVWEGFSWSISWSGIAQGITRVYTKSLTFIPFFQTEPSEPIS